MRIFRHIAAITVFATTIFALWYFWPSIGVPPGGITGWQIAWLSATLTVFIPVLLFLIFREASTPAAADNETATAGATPAATQGAGTGTTPPTALDQFKHDIASKRHFWDWTSWIGTGILTGAFLGILYELAYQVLVKAGVNATLWIDHIAVWDGYVIIVLTWLIVTSAAHFNSVSHFQRTAYGYLTDKPVESASVVAWIFLETLLALGAFWAFYAFGVMIFQRLWPETYAKMGGTPVMALEVIAVSCLIAYRIVKNARLATLASTGKSAGTAGKDDKKKEGLTLKQAFGKILAVMLVIGVIVGLGWLATGQSGDLPNRDQLERFGRNFFWNSPLKEWFDSPASTSPSVPRRSAPEPVYSAPPPRAVGPSPQFASDPHAREFESYGYVLKDVRSIPYSGSSNYRNWTPYALGGGNRPADIRTFDPRGELELADCGGNRSRAGYQDKLLFPDTRCETVWVRSTIPGRSTTMHFFIIP